MRFDAIILAGGRGTRLGEVSKADLEIGGRRLLDIVLEATAGASTTVVVGDVTVPPRVVLTRESPAGTGPAAGLLAGLDAVEDPQEWVLVLACDLPDAPALARRLLAALDEAHDTADGLVLRDGEGDPQHLAALYRTASLRRAFAAYGPPEHRSVRGLVAHLSVLPVDPGGARTDDLDTPEQLSRWLAGGAPSAPAQAQEDRAGWRRFVEDAAARIDVDPALVDEHAVLRLTRRIAHRGARPMAPVMAHLWGRALGEHPDTDAATLAMRLEQALETAPLPSSQETD